MSEPQLEPLTNTNPLLGDAKALREIIADVGNGLDSFIDRLEKVINGLEFHNDSLVADINATKEHTVKTLDAIQSNATALASRAQEELASKIDHTTGASDMVAKILADLRGTES